MMMMTTRTSRSSRTRSRRPKVLCLGVSYPNVVGQLLHRTRSPHAPRHHRLDDETVDAAVACVRHGILTQMDGRDLARCRSTEQACHVDVYTVSQEQGSCYRPDRHLDANFNRHDFCRSLRDAFTCQFDEIILDYFWIPVGWDANHWGRAFFEHTLVSLVKENVLKERTGVIYLPFCFHCFKQVQVCFDVLRQYYNVSFVRKDQLDAVSLWKGTQGIDSPIMQGVLGKHLSQEETYCTFGPRDVMEAMEDPDVSKHDLLQLARSLEDFADIRFLRLEQLPPPSRKKPLIGYFLGCMDPSRVKRGFDQSPSSPAKMAPEPRCKRKLFATRVVQPATKRTPATSSPQRPTRKRKRIFTPSRQRKARVEPKKSNQIPTTPPVRPRLETGTASRAASTSTSTTTTPDSARLGCNTVTDNDTATPAPSPHGYPTRARSTRDTTPLPRRLVSPMTSRGRKKRTKGGWTVAATTVAVTPIIDHRYPTRSRSPCTVASLALDGTATPAFSSSEDVKSSSMLKIALFQQQQQQGHSTFAPDGW